jgi:midasin
VDDDGDGSSSGESSESLKFKWSDGVFLKALKNGDWVLLDELNLAPQAVLEGTVWYLYTSFTTTAYNICLTH